MLKLDNMLVWGCDSREDQDLNVDEQVVCNFVWVRNALGGYQTPLVGDAST